MYKEHKYLSDYVLFGKMTPEHEKAHNLLSEIVKDLPEDYEPYGNQERDDSEIEQPDSRSGYYGDCSCGCRWYAKLEGKLGADWG